MLRSISVARAAAASTLLTLSSLLTACGHLTDALSPGRAEEYQKVPARVALAAQLPSFTQSQLASPQLRVRAFYEHIDSTRVSMTSLQLSLADVATQTIPFSINLASCLTDTKRRGTELGTGHAAVCLVFLELTLLDGTREVDQQTVGPLRLMPGETSTLSDPVSLFEVASIQVVPPAGTTNGVVRLERGKTVALTAAVTSTSGQVVPGRAVQWTSSAPAVAQVNATTGVVTATGVGPVRVSATSGARTGTIDLNVVPPPSTITVVALTPGAGSGRVQSTPAGIDCRVANGQTSGTCAAPFLGDAQVTLTAVPDSNSAFGSWGGACLGIGVGPTCVVSADQARTVSVAFSPRRTLTVGSAVAAGATGAGRVSSSPVGVDCQINSSTASGMCAGSFADGQAVTLTAAPADQNTFLGWTGDCAATLGPICTVTLSGGDRSTGARFGGPIVLSVGVTGGGSGTVSVLVNGQPALTCVTGAAQCTTPLPIGTIVTLVATPDAGSMFAGWTGACNGLSTCQVTIDQARSVGAIFVRRTITLTLALGGAGAGTVQLNGQTSCTLVAGQGAATCRVSIEAGTTVTLLATPGAGSGFTGWSGPCATTTGTTCVIVPLTDQTIGVAFARVVGLSLSVQSGGGTASGTVTTSPAGVNCTVTGTTTSGTCTNTFASGSVVTLTATPGANAHFAGWGGACSTATGITCTVTIAAATAVTARFDVGQGFITVAGAGTGVGTISSVPVGIACSVNQGVSQPGSVCSATFTNSGNVVLTATADAGSTFAGWSGPCAATTTPMCTVDPTTSPTVTATFTRTALPTNVLSVSRTGTGSGTVGSSPGGIDCPRSCSASFAPGTVVTLTATPNGGSGFGGWSGACTGIAPTCTVVMDQAKNVVATFSAIVSSFPLTVNVAGAAGTVTSTPSGILCPTSCVANFTPGTVVTLTATPSSGNVFIGWSGACTGVGPCVVTMEVAQNVTATFAPPSPILTVSTNGTGSGSVTSSPGGINCPSTCAASFGFGAIVTLSATPSANSVFTGWSGACSGTGTCQVTVDQVRAVTATFTGTVTLTVGPDQFGFGSGQITSSGVAPAINCFINGLTSSGTCSVAYPIGTVVRLTATAASGSSFDAWGGACASVGVEPCTLTLTAPTTVTARLNVPNLRVILRTTGVAGSVTIAVGALRVSCTIEASATSTSECDYVVPRGATVALEASPANSFVGWDAPCDAQRSTRTTCIFTFASPNGATAFATFAPTAVRLPDASLIRPASAVQRRP